jgi:hypothetical protein
MGQFNTRQKKKIDADGIFETESRSNQDSMSREEIGLSSGQALWAAESITNHDFTRPKRTSILRIFRDVIHLI